MMSGNSPWSRPIRKNDQFLTYSFTHKPFACNFTGSLTERKPWNALITWHTSDCALLEFVKLALDEAKYKTGLSDGGLS